MAKKKNEILESVENLILGSDFLSDKKEILRVSPAFDVGLGGGIPQGSWVILTGKPKLGKSSAAIHMVAKFLQQFPQGNALYVDVETRLKEINLRNQFLDVSRLDIMRSQQDDILQAEEFLTRTENYIKSNPNSIVVVDSVSSLCSTTEYTDPIKGTTRSLGPKLMANFTRKMAPIIPVQNCIIILITHQIANTSGYGSPFSEDGGNKIQYQADIKLKCKNKEEWLDGTKNIGQVVNWNVEFSALGPPGMSISSCFRYNYGLDEGMELARIGVDFGLITRGGSWYNATFLALSEDPTVLEYIENSGKPKENVFKFQGIEGMGNFLNQNDHMRAILFQQVMEMVM